MVYRLLLAFGLVSTLMLIDVAVATSGRSGHESFTTASSANCNPKNPKYC